MVSITQNNEILFDDGLYILDAENNTLHCKKNNKGFEIVLKFSTDKRENEEAIKAVSEFFERAIW